MGSDTLAGAASQACEDGLMEQWNPVAMQSTCFALKKDNGGLLQVISHQLKVNSENQYVSSSLNSYLCRQRAE